MTFCPDIEPRTSSRHLKAEATATGEMSCAANKAIAGDALPNTFETHVRATEIWNGILRDLHFTRVVQKY